MHSKIYDKMATATAERRSGKTDKVTFTWANHADTYYKHFALWAKLSDDESKRFEGMLQKVQQDRNFEAAMDFWREINLAWVARTGTIPNESKSGFAQDIARAATEEEASLSSRRMLYLHADHYKYQFAGILEDHNNYNKAMKEPLLPLEGEYKPELLNALPDGSLKSLAIKYPQFLVVDKKSNTVSIRLLQACMKVEEDLKEDLKDAIANGQEDEITTLQDKLGQWRLANKNILEKAMANADRGKPDIVSSGVRFTPINLFNALGDAEYMHDSDDYLNKEKGWAWEFLYLFSMAAYTGRFLKGDGGEKMDVFEMPPMQAPAPTGSSRNSEFDMPPLPMSESGNLGEDAEPEWGAHAQEENNMPPLPGPEGAEMQNPEEEAAAAQLIDAVALEEKRRENIYLIDTLDSSNLEDSIRKMDVKAGITGISGYKPLLLELVRRLAFNSAIEADAIDIFMRVHGYEIDIDEKDYYGTSAMTWAVHIADLTAVKKLLEHGADINLKGEGGESLLEIARESKTSYEIDKSPDNPETQTAVWQNAHDIWVARRAELIAFLEERMNG